VVADEVDLDLLAVEIIDRVRGRDGVNDLAVLRECGMDHESAHRRHRHVVGEADDEMHVAPVAGQSVDVDLCGLWAVGCGLLRGLTRQCL
jgi:hypothetical protein